MTLMEDFETEDSYKKMNEVEKKLENIVQIQVTDLAIYEFVEYLEDLLKECYDLELEVLSKETELEMKENELKLNTDWKEVLTGSNNADTRKAYIEDKLHLLRDEVREKKLELKFKYKKYDLEKLRYSGMKQIHYRETEFKGLRTC